ncbi:MAG TPA: chemotaxis response regulator protein-glutamate methylesterase [Phycisphaerae bacterium]|nr:chemotaxis response regulator protein-glutamate methylesterase [Phycisphaerae bacterium]HSA26678.1 chemotaxis response regulator protein-glutamate methylesterase [Phycisphaerae bacterium]
MPTNLTRVLIVDDSAVVRQILASALRSDPRIEVVGVATDGRDALVKIHSLRPDVVTLDVEMPRLNGLGVLERVPSRAPVAFVMVSSLTQSGARITMEALHKGAFDFVTKPRAGRMTGSADFRTRLCERVLAAARNKYRRRVISSGTMPTNAPSLPPNKVRGWVVAIGISCGGPQTLVEMLPAFPSDFPPILLTQHMPAAFTSSFARYLNAASSMTVLEATHLARVESGHVYVAPGNQHLRLNRRGTSLVIELDDGPKVSGHRPSADALFDSVARTCGPFAIGIIMTGMGADGAQGLRQMRQNGAWTIAQDEETSLVYGMPKEAVKIGAADGVVPLSKIPLTVARLMSRGPKKAASGPQTQPLQLSIT